MLCQIAALSRTGGRDYNEDACAWLEAGGMVCCVLADGAGGHGGGDVASRLAVQSVLDGFAGRPEVSCQLARALLDGANRMVCGHQRDDARLADMRSTIVVLLFDPLARRAVWGHVGDSRLYWLRDGRQHLQTRDHSLVQTLIDSGLLTAEQALSQGNRNVLVASLGSVDDYHPSVADQPVDVVDGDAFLLCSDGFWGTLADTDIEMALASEPDAQQWLARLENTVTGRLRPGADNYSAVAVRCGDLDQATRIMVSP